MRNLCIVMHVIIGIVTAAFTLIFGLMCKPPEGYWDLPKRTECRAIWKNNFAFLAVNVATEVVLLMMPLAIFGRVQLRKSDKAGLIAIFTLFGLWVDTMLTSFWFQSCWCWVLWRMITPVANVESLLPIYWEYRRSYIRKEMQTSLTPIKLLSAIAASNWMYASPVLAFLLPKYPSLARGLPFGSHLAKTLFLTRLLVRVILDSIRWDYLKIRTSLEFRKIRKLEKASMMAAALFPSQYWHKLRAPT